MHQPGPPNTSVPHKAPPMMIPRHNVLHPKDKRPHDEDAVPDVEPGPVDPDERDIQKTEAALAEPDLPPQEKYSDGADINWRGLNSYQDEAEFGIKMVPRPEDVIEYDAEPQPPPPHGLGRSSGGKSQGQHVGSGADEVFGHFLNRREVKHRHAEVSHGSTDWKHQTRPNKPPLESEYEQS